ncbi:hypothetical protein BBJ28_00019875 [Nothophytophthora sp. Chile5]|nr:hypothetical protein BBJ28_00019875 [Nothophytophthora sp. Chile5]
MAMSSYALGTYVPTLISLWDFNVFANWSTIVLLYVAQVLGCIMAASTVETYGLKRSLAFFASLGAVASMMLSQAPWSGPIVVSGTFTVSALLAGSWSCVLAYTPEHYMPAVRGRGVGYAFSFSRVGAIGGSLLYPHMFNVWVLSVTTITWVFAGLLVIVVVGIVLPYGYDPLLTEDSDRDAYLEVGTDDEEFPLVANDDQGKALRRYGTYDQNLERKTRQEAEAATSLAHRRLG